MPTNEGREVDPSEAPVDPLDVFDKWLKRFFFLYLPVLGLIVTAFITYVLPHITIFAAATWFLISIICTFVGFGEWRDFLRSRAKWRFLCFLAGFISLTIWVNELVAQSPKEGRSLLETFAVWQWNLSGALWLLTLVHSINQTHYHLINTLMVTWNRYRHLEPDDDSSKWTEQRLREIDGNPYGPVSFW